MTQAEGGGIHINIYPSGVARAAVPVCGRTYRTAAPWPRRAKAEPRQAKAEGNPHGLKPRQATASAGRG